jgi:hypothetical protein
VDISYEAKIKSMALMDFDGKEALKEEEIVVPVEEKKEITVAEEIPKLTAFEEYFGYKPEQVVLTKKEEEEWKKQPTEWLI